MSRQKRPVLVQLCLAALLACASAGSRVHAQQAGGKNCSSLLGLSLVDVADDASTRLRTLQLAGEAPLRALTIRRPSLDRATACDAAGRQAPRLELLPLRARAIYNSEYPLDINNGALWAGRGWNAAVSAGAEIRIGPFSAAVYPTFLHQQNAPFHTRPATWTPSPYAYPWHRIDWPLRHGNESFSLVDAGQSYARVEAYGLTAGVSTENLWLGPAQRMPLLMGSSAPGFPHAFAGTAGARDVRIGALDVQLFWGRLSESDYFDSTSENDHNLIAGFAAVFEPAFARGLFLGVNRMYLAGMTDGTSVLEYMIDPYIGVRDNTAQENQLLSLYARWVHPSVGFEAYAEWARDDHWADFHDLLREPDHSQAYTLGFQKTGRLGGATLRWFGELAHLEASQTMRGGRGVVTFYTHGGLSQGFTHRGQLLGAWIGPGSDGQLLGVERSDARRITSLLVERVRFDADAYYNQWARFFGQNGHDVAWGGTLRHVERLGPVSLHAALSYANRQNRNFALLHEGAPDWFTYEDNYQLDLEARWVPRFGW